MVEVSARALDEAQLLALIFESLESCNETIAEIESFGHFFPEYSLQMIGNSFDSLMGNEVAAEALSPCESALAYLRAAENQAALYLIDKIYLAEAFATYEQLHDANCQACKSDLLQDKCKEARRLINELSAICSPVETELDNLAPFMADLSAANQYQQKTLELLDVAREAYYLAEDLFPEREKLRSCEMRDKPVKVIDGSMKIWNIAMVVSALALVARIAYTVGAAGFL